MMVSDYESYFSEDNLTADFRLVISDAVTGVDLLTNNHLIADSFELRESLISGSTFKLGKLESNQIGFTYFGNISITKKQLLAVRMEWGEDSILLGKYVVDDNTLQSDGVKRKVTAYNRTKNVEGILPIRFFGLGIDALWIYWYQLLGEAGLEYDLPADATQYATFVNGTDYVSQLMMDADHEFEYEYRYYHAYAIGALEETTYVAPFYVRNPEHRNIADAFKKFWSTVNCPEANTVKGLNPGCIYSSFYYQDKDNNGDSEAYANTFVCYNRVEIWKCDYATQAPIELVDSYDLYKDAPKLYRARSIQTPFLNGDLTCSYLPHATDITTGDPVFEDDMDTGQDVADVIEAVAEVAAAFPYENRNGKIELRCIETIGAFPDLSRYPSNSLYPGGSRYRIDRAHLTGIPVKEGPAITIKGVGLPLENGEVASTYTEIDPYANTVYSLEGNLLLQNHNFNNTGNNQLYCQRIAGALKGLVLQPFKSTCMGRPEIEPGDVISIDGSDVAVLSRQLKGIRRLNDTLENKTEVE